MLFEKDNEWEKKKKRKKEGLLILLLSGNLQNHAYRRKKKYKAFKMFKISTVKKFQPNFLKPKKEEYKRKKGIMKGNQTNIIGE